MADSDRQDPFRHVRHLDHSTFGDDAFGRFSEAVARRLGSAKFILWSTAMIVTWITLNVVFRLWDRYPFILLNLVFSAQAFYAAPLILLAQTRQSERDKASAEADARHREEVAAMQQALLQENTDLTREVRENTEQIKAVRPYLSALAEHFGLEVDAGPPATGV
jgi:uncharacterized membrane protein